MADGILYLDVDDEITSAAARVRAVAGGRVAVVLPYGSRVATSRINFRLLARDALTHEKRLSVIATDSATRALAASAGLPVFASVSEYEASLGPSREVVADSEPAPKSAAAVRKAKRAAAASAAVPDGTPEAIWAETARVETPVDGTDRGRDTTAGVAAAAAAGAGLAATSGTRAADTPGPIRPTPGFGDAPVDAQRRTDVPITSSRGTGRRTPVAVGLAVLALALLVGVVGAYLFLPSATIVVTPRTRTVGPISLTVIADPDTTEPDPSVPSVPADTLSVDVDTTDTFPATGKRVEETAATGSVRFRNVDFTASNFIPAGSIVSANGGIRFRTDRSVTVGAASLVGLQIVPKTASVPVTAVEPGPEGNLEPNSILTIPKDESPVTLSVTNPEATTGGTREEFPKVTQADVDAALAALDVALRADFAEQVADPALAPPGSTVFPETAVLGEATPSVDPATLVGVEAASFDLGLSATGTVIAVDEAPVASIAETRLRETVAAGSELVEDSIDIEVGTAVVVDGVVTFPVSASATQVAVLDPDELKTLILGKTPAEAEVILAPYGTAVIELSPSWVSTIPTFENRVDLTVDAGPTDDAEVSPSP